MALHGADAEVEHLRDLAVAQAIRHEVGDDEFRAPTAFGEFEYASSIGNYVRGVNVRLFTTTRWIKWKVSVG